MPCLISEDGKMAICGPLGRREYYFFTADRKAVLIADSLWYEPNLVLKREKGERLAEFRARVKKKLRFVPQGYPNYRLWSRA